MNERPVTQHSHNLYAQLDLREIAAEVLGQGRRSGKAVLYHSPWRSDDDHASFAVYADGWKDFGGSQEAGNLYSFLQRHYGWTFAEAQDFVQARMGGISHPLTPLPHSHTSATSEPPATDWQTAAQQALKEAIDYLWSERTDAQQVLDYLHRERGLTDETIRYFRLGYNPHWTRLDTRMTDGKRTALPPGIVIPIWADGALWALRVRCRVGNLADWLGIPPDRDRQGQELAKYLNASGSKLTGSLFNGDSLTTDQAVLLVEGEFDAMLAQQMLGTQAAVVTLGSASNHLSARWLPRLEAAQTIFIALDNDAAGQAAAEKLRQAILSPAHCLPIPQGKDITEYVVDHQGDLRAWLKTALLPSPAWWSQGVPDSWRRAALRYLPPSAALILELLNDALRTGLLDPNGFTMQQAQEANISLGYQVARSTLAKALDTLTDLFISKLETGSEAGNTVSKTEKNNRSGRTADCYRALPLSEVKRNLLAWISPRIYEREHPLGKNPTLIRFSATMLDDTLESDENPAALAQELNQELETIWQAQDGWQKRAAQRAKRRRMQVIAALDDPHSTPLPVGWSKHNASAYRVAFAHALGKAQPEMQMSRREVCELLGVANGTLDKVIAQAGWEATLCYEEYPVMSGDDISQQVQARGRECQGYPLTIRVETAAGQVSERSYRQCEDAPSWIAQQLAAGGQLWIRYQVANRYRVVREEPPELLPKAAHQVASPVPRPSPDETAPVRPKPFYGTSYNPAWVIGQLELALKLSGWRPLGDQWLNPKTGEVVAPDPCELVSALLGRPLRVDGLLEFAREELGAVMIPVKGRIRAYPPPRAV